MIGIQGEVYTNTKEKFERSYILSEIAYNLNVPYNPTIKNRLNGIIIPLNKHVRSCIPSGEVYIYANALEKSIKIFTQWNEDKYMLGNIGDYIAVRSDDIHDIYVIEKEIFMLTYEEC